MKKRIYLLLIAIIIPILLLSGCSMAETVTNNIQKEADKFGVYRKMTFVNLYTGELLYSAEGYFSLQTTYNNEYQGQQEIDNLSSILTAQNSDEGYVGKFGDKLKVVPISKRNGALIQTTNITQDRYEDVGGNTENGIWLFFKQAIAEKQHWDNIFIYSDMQAGHGGLYGINPSGYEDFRIGYGRYIDVNKLIKTYRQKVNPKVNVFMVQTAGYTNVLVPEYGYRTNILTGWTGKETLFAKAMIDFWDDVDNKKEKRNANIGNTCENQC